MSIIERIKARYRWTWVGSVKGICIFDGKSDTPHCVFWSLFVRGDGKRKFIQTGEHKYAQSAHMLRALNSVLTWQQGGPMPSLYEQAPAAPKPKEKAKLLVFKGGRDAS